MAWAAMGAAAVMDGQRNHGTRRPRAHRPVSTPPVDRLALQVQALGLELVLVRLSDPVRRRRQNQRIPAGDLTEACARAWNEDGYDVTLAAAAPDGLVALSGIDRAALSRLSANGLAPCAVVKVGPRFDVWIRLAEPGEREGSDPKVLTWAARRLAALAGLDPRPGHWQRGGAATSTVVYSRGARPARLTESSGAVAQAGAALLGMARSAVEATGAAIDAAYAAGVDPLGEIDALAEYTGPEAEAQAILVYQRHAAIGRRYGVEDADQLDRIVTAAALKAGGSPDRVRALLRAGSPDLARRHGNVKHYLAATLRDALLDSDLRRFVAAQQRRYDDLARLIDRTWSAASAATLLQTLDDADE